MAQGSMIISFPQGLRLGERVWASAWLPKPFNLMKVNHLHIQEEASAWVVHSISAHGSPAMLKEDFLQGEAMNAWAPEAFKDHVLMPALQSAMELALLIEYVGDDWKTRVRPHTIMAPDGTGETRGYGFVAGSTRHVFTCEVSGEVF
jgi:hypothetical protein